MSAREHPGDLLSAYLDDELSAGEASEVEAHLVHCSPCSAELDDLAAARRLLRDLPPVAAPPGFTRGLVEQRRRWTRRGAGLAAVAAGVALLAGLALAEPPDDDPPARAQPLSLTGDASRLDTTFGSPSASPGAGSPGPQQSDRPQLGQGGPSATSTTTTTTATATTTTEAARDTGPDERSDPVTVGDRIDEVATNLLELIGG